MLTISIIPINISKKYVNKKAGREHMSDKKNKDNRKEDTKSKKNMKKLRKCQ